LPLLGTAVLVGAASGILEVGIRLFQIHRLHQINDAALQTSRHLVWMAPLGSVILCLATTSLVFAFWRIRARRFRKPRVRIIAADPTLRLQDRVGAALGSLALAGPLLSVRGLHPAAALVLACGAGYRLRRAVTLPARNWPRKVSLVAALILALTPPLVLWQWRQAAIPAPPAGPARSDAANLVLIVLDTVRADRFGLYGHSRPTTPAIDAWAKQGMTFDLAYSAAPWTLPSHLTMFTGLWPHEHGARVDRPYSGAAPTLAEALHARGHATAGFVANTRMCNSLYGVGRGFATYVDDPAIQEISARAIIRACAVGDLLLKASARAVARGAAQPRSKARRPAHTVLAEARAWLDHQYDASPRESPSSRRPYFLFVNLMDAHGPYLPPPHVAGRFASGKTTLPKEAQAARGWFAVKARNEAAPAHRPACQRELDEITRRLSDLYDECLLGLDAAVGKFLDDLRRDGLLENTWVAITSDHGEHFGEHDLFGHGASLYNELTHVPLILIPPMNEEPARDIPPRGLRVTSPVSLRDLPFTLATLVDPAGSHPFPGQSLARFWTEVDPSADPVLAQLEAQPLEGHDVQAELVTKMDALIHEERILIESNAHGQALFDLRGDRAQHTNLVERPAESERLRRLKDTLQRLSGRNQAATR
jgi:arylsulfatase A-like enzyme